MARSFRIAVVRALHALPALLVVLALGLQGVTAVAAPHHPEGASAMDVPCPHGVDGAADAASPELAHAADAGAADAADCGGLHCSPVIGWQISRPLPAAAFVWLRRACGPGLGSAVPPAQRCDRPPRIS